MAQGFRRYLMVALTFALAYEILSWFSKVYVFKVLVGSTYRLNDAFLCGGYLIAVSSIV